MKQGFQSLIRGLDWPSFAARPGGPDFLQGQGCRNVVGDGAQPHVAGFAVKAVVPELVDGVGRQLQRW